MLLLTSYISDEIFFKCFLDENIVSKDARQETLRNWNDRNTWDEAKLHMSKNCILFKIENFAFDGFLVNFCRFEKFAMFRRFVN